MNLSKNPQPAYALMCTIICIYAKLKSNKLHVYTSHPRESETIALKAYAVKGLTDTLSTTTAKACIRQSSTFTLQLAPFIHLSTSCTHLPENSIISIVFSLNQNRFPSISVPVVPSSSPGKRRTMRSGSSIKKSKRNHDFLCANQGLRRKEENSERAVWMSTYVNLYVNLSWVLAMRHCEQ